MNPAKPSHPLLPVAGLLFSATLWGIVWYPLRLLETVGLAGAWSALVSYSAALLACAWVFVRDSRAVAENTLYLLLMAMAAGDPIEIRHEYARYTFEQTGSHFAGWFQFQPHWEDLVASDGEDFLGSGGA